MLMSIVNLPEGDAAPPFSKYFLSRGPSFTEHLVDLELMEL